MTQYRNIPIALPCTGDDEWQACREPLESGWLTQGPRVSAFESAFAERHDVSYALSTSNCTTGLHLILAAMGVGSGDEVIVPAFTWVATANVVLYVGATPVFADVDRTTYNMSPTEIARRVTSKTKAVIPVHLFGLCADVDGIRALLPDHVKVIEDAACAAGACYKGTCAGGLGDAAAFSFHPRKSITTGEGGMVTTHDAHLAEVMRQLRNHGASVSEEERQNGPKPYVLPEFNLLGFNYRMTDLQGAVGLAQLAKLDRFIEERQRWADWYKDELESIEWLQTPTVPDGYNHAWQSFVTYVDPAKAPLARSEIMERLKQRGVATRPGTHAVHMLGLYRDRFDLCADNYPCARDCEANTMAIPLHNCMTPDDYAYVVQALKDIS